MKKRPFYYFWIAQTSISLADVVYIMVITTFIYQNTGSAFIASMFPLLNALARIAAGFTAPILLHRFRYSKLLVSLQLIKAFLISIVLLGFSTITSQLYYLLPFVLVIAFMEGWGNPLLSSVLPKVVSQDDLVKANSSLSITSQSVQIAGYTFTGYLVIKFGHMPTLSVSVVLLWLSTVCLALLVRSFPVKEEVSENNKTKWESIKEGWLILWENQTLKMVTLMDIIEGMAGTIWVGAITLVYVKEALHKGEQWWGFINASYYIGAILGGIFTLLLAKKVQKHLVLSMAIGSFLFSVLTLLYGLNSIPVISLILCVAMGPAYQIRDVAQQTAYQTSIDSSSLPRVYASRSILLSTITSLSIALVGLTTDTLGIRMVYVFGAILIAISAMLSFTILRMKKGHHSSLEIN